MPEPKPAATFHRTRLKAKDDNQRFDVKVFSPYQTYYRGKAVSLSASNKTGPFDVLYGHANFFSLLTASDVIVQTGFERLSFPINRGVIKVSSNQATIFVDV